MKFFYKGRVDDKKTILTIVFTWNTKYFEI